MLPKQYRFPLRHYPDFFHSAERMFLPGCMVFRQRAETTTAPSRATVIVAKKTAAKATERNLIKRRFYAALAPVLPHSFGNDYVIVAKKNLTVLEVTALLNKIL